MCHKIRSSLLRDVPQFSGSPPARLHGTNTFTVSILVAHIPFVMVMLFGRIAKDFANRELCLNRVSLDVHGSIVGIPIGGRRSYLE